MIPIRDINPRLRVPWVNYVLLAGCVLAFLFQLGLGRDVEALILDFGFTPRDLDQALASGRPEAILPVVRTMITASFLHGGWFHILGNLLYLRVFGDNVEDRFGHLGFLVFYFASGIAAAIGQYAIDPTSSVPMIGASGAIAGVLGAYIVLFPRARVLTLFPVFIFLTFIEVPAMAFLGIWALQQFLNGFLTITSNVYQNTPGGGGVAWFAHIGGFALGLVAGVIVRIIRALRRP